MLRQPLFTVDEEARGCYFAFVDGAAAAVALRQSKARTTEEQSDGPLLKSSPAPRVGVWQLLIVHGSLPFGNARRDSRVPKMLPHRFFPDASYCVWIDAKLQLAIQPEHAVDRFLKQTAAGFAALRNLRRQTIAHELGWIQSWMCPPPGSPATKESDACAQVHHQWAFYSDEHSGHGSSHGGAGGVGDGSGGIWTAAVIEGALLVLDLRSTSTICLLCNWFEEFARFSERDQLSFSYVMHAQQPPPRVYMIPRRLHWSATVEQDTASCYGATDADTRTLAVRFQHGSRSHVGGSPTAARSKAIAAWRRAQRRP